MTEVIYSKFIDEKFETYGYMEFFETMSQYINIDEDFNPDEVFFPTLEKLNRVFDDDLDDYLKCLETCDIRISNLLLISLKEKYELIGIMIDSVIDSDYLNRDELIELFDTFIFDQFNDYHPYLYNKMLEYREFKITTERMLEENIDNEDLESFIN